MALPAHSGPRHLIQIRNHVSQTVELLGRVISPSQGRYLNTGRHKQNKRIHTPNIHALSGIRTHDPRVRASEDSSCLRPRGYYDRHPEDITLQKYEGEPLNKSQMDIKSKTRDIQTRHKHIFLDISSTNIDTLPHRFTSASNNVA
jgi:hypothetical protein